MLDSFDIKMPSNSTSKNQSEFSNSNNGYNTSRERRSKYTSRQKEKNKGKKLTLTFNGRDEIGITNFEDSNLISEDSSSTTSSSLSLESKEKLSNPTYPKITNNKCGKLIFSDEGNFEGDTSHEKTQIKQKIITDNLRKPNKQFARHCYFEIPVGLKEGTKLCVLWPDGQSFVINCPKTFDKNKPETVCVVAPGENPPSFPLHTSESIDRRKRKRKKVETEEWLWDEYKKKSSRIGRQYQIKYLPCSNEHQQKKTDVVQ